MKEYKQLTFIQHLEELRRRILLCSAVVLAASLGSYCFTDKLLPYIVKPIGRVVFLQPIEPFIVYLKLAFFCGILISLPFVIYQIWAFISAGLMENERYYAVVFGFVSLLFFILGAVFAYRVIIPAGLKFLMSFSSSYLVPMISVSQYIYFIAVTCLAFGVVFELPVAALFLSKIGIVNYKILRKKRRIATALIFITAAVLTPPDIFSQLMMAIPLLLLYEISILFSWLSGLKKQNKKN